MIMRLTNKSDKATTRFSLRIELAILLIVKLAALYLLWLYCFSTPVNKADIANHFKQQLFNAHSEVSQRGYHE